MDRHYYAVMWRLNGEELFHLVSGPSPERAFLIGREWWEEHGTVHGSMQVPEMHYLGKQPEEVLESTFEQLLQGVHNILSYRGLTWSQVEQMETEIMGLFQKIVENDAE